MGLDIDHLVNEARRLPDEDRIRLVERILATLDAEAEEGVAEAWAAEIERRSREIEQGTAKPIPWSEVKVAARRRARERS